MNGTKFKVGDLVYYISNYPKTDTKYYCLIDKIVDNKIWGNWTKNLEDVNTYDRNYGWMGDYSVYLYKKLIPKQFKEVKK